MEARLDRMRLGVALQSGIIFDLDGVLTDTERFHRCSWQRLADELGFDFPAAAADDLRGLARRDALELFLAGREPEVERGVLLERKNRFFLELIEELGPDDLAPGARRLLDEAERRGARIGLASSSRNARLVCARLGVLERFDAFVDGCSGLRPKPAPDSFLWVAGRLSLAPHRCTVIEDSTAGVRAARTGGFRAVGLGPRERVGEADLVLAELAHVGLDELLLVPPSRSSAPNGHAREGFG